MLLWRTSAVILFSNFLLLVTLLLLVVDILFVSTFCKGLDWLLLGLLLGKALLVGGFELLSALCGLWLWSPGALLVIAVGV